VPNATEVTEIVHDGDCAQALVALSNQRAAAIDARITARVIDVTHIAKRRG
jgi:hypothetical protein